MKKECIFLILAAMLVFAGCNERVEDLTKKNREGDGTESTNNYNVKEDDQPYSVQNAEGFYIVNEDWFGHSNGSLNYFSKNGDSYEQHYRVFRKENPEIELGITTCFGAIWGNYIYLISKQGNRLVIADAETLKLKHLETDLGGDGRSFVGIDEKKVYIGYNGGIRPFDIDNMTLGNSINGISGQIGNMCMSSGKVFAVSQSNLYVIDAMTDELLQNIPGSYNSLVVSKDGSVWVATSDKFVIYNPENMESTNLDYPNEAKVAGTWGAWNPGSLCSSTQNNVLYWTIGGGMFGGANTICRYDIDSNTANTSFYQIPEDEDGYERAFYGAGLRVDPLSDNLVLQCYRKGFGESYSYNWLFILDNKGEITTSFAVADDSKSLIGNGYYWFPTMPVFKDANKPQILLNQIIVPANSKTEIDLTEKIIDYDNTFSSIIKRVYMSDNNKLQASLSIIGNNLSIEAGNTDGSGNFTLSVVSNGVLVEKEIELIITKTTDNE